MNVTSRIAALGVATAIMASGAVAGATTAQAATVAKGPGLTLKVAGKNVFVGPYRVDGKLLYCTDEGFEIGNGKVVKGGGAPKLNAETRARVNLVVNTYGNVADGRSGARVKLAVATLVAPFDPKMRKALPGLLAAMTPADRLAISNPRSLTDPKQKPGMVEASATHAPYRVSKHLTGAVPGQRGSAWVTVLGSNGKPAVGRTVVFKLNGATTSGGTVKTNTAGKATLGFAAAGLGQSLIADVVSPSSTAVWQNTPTRGHQLMVGGGFTDTVRVSDVAELCPVFAEHKRVCDCKKTGLAQVAVKWLAEDFAGWYQGYATVNGNVVKTVALNASGVADATITVKPGDDVEIGYRIYGTSSRTGTALYSDVLDSWTQKV